MLVELLGFWLASAPLPPQPAVFRPATREVSNWRAEAADALALPLLQALGLRYGSDVAGLSRCVRLNNYWCIKRAGWAGEIAADGEGHVAFSSSGEGALVAAVLLRRYYVDFKRHSALDIVSHWAPANCGGGGVVAASTGAKRSPKVKTAAPPALRMTLRARFLASRGHGVKLRRSIVADRPVPMLRAPGIAAGLGEHAVAVAAVASVALEPLWIDGTLPREPKAGVVTSCASESARIANYARRASTGIAAETVDLKLFDSDGLPTANLAHLMENMASVEIGPMRADRALIDAAVVALQARIREKAAAAAVAPQTQP